MAVRGGDQQRPRVDHGLRTAGSRRAARTGCPPRSSRRSRPRSAGPAQAARSASSPARAPPASQPGPPARPRRPPARDQRPRRGSAATPTAAPASSAAATRPRMASRSASRNADSTGHPHQPGVGHHRRDLHAVPGLLERHVLRVPPPQGRRPGPASAAQPPGGQQPGAAPPPGHRSGRASASTAEHQPEHRHALGGRPHSEVGDGGSQASARVAHPLGRREQVSRPCARTELGGHRQQVRVDTAPPDRACWAMAISCGLATTRAVSRPTPTAATLARLGWRSSHGARISTARIAGHDRGLLVDQHRDAEHHAEHHAPGGGRTAAQPDRGLDGQRQEHGARRRCSGGPSPARPASRTARRTRPAAIAPGCERSHSRAPGTSRSRAGPASGS